MLAAVVSAASLRGAADPWEVAGDDNLGTDNELVHGTSQLHDLEATGGVTDQDWYLIGQRPYSSYEVVVDGLAGALATIPPTVPADPVQVDLMQNSGGIFDSAHPISGHGSSRSLRIRNTTGTEILNQSVRVTPGSGCSTTCTSAAQYTIRMRETTIFAPRFNNTGTQTTVVLVQNATTETFPYAVRFFNGAGTLLASFTSTLAARGVVAIQTASIVGLAGTSGSMTLDHYGPYGGVVAKAVALEPATGFTFDTAFVPRPF